MKPAAAGQRTVGIALAMRVNRDSGPEGISTAALVVVRSTKPAHPM